MTRFLRAWWQMIAVVLFTAVLVLQIPRKALFYVPAIEGVSEPFVSFLALDDGAYKRLVRRMRMSWQMSGRTMAGGMADSRIDAFSFAEPLPPPACLPYRGGSKKLSLPPPSPLALSALTPPSLGVEMPPVASAEILPDRDPDLLAIPDGLLKAGPSADFKLQMERTIK